MYDHHFFLLLFALFLSFSVFLSFNGHGLLQRAVDINMSSLSYDNTATASHYLLCFYCIAIMQHLPDPLFWPYIVRPNVERM